MAPVTPKKMTLAATGTALLAFLLIVPTVLVASGALGQNNPLCAATGYCATVPSSTGSTGAITAGGGVGNLAAGQSATIVIGQPTSAPLETASVIPDSVINNLISSPATLTATLNDPAQLQQLATAPAALQTLLANADARQAILSNADALNAILGSGLGASAALQNDAVRSAVVSQLGSNAQLTATVASNPAALTSLLQDSGAASTLINQVTTNSAVLDALSHNTAAVGALLQNDAARQAITSNAQVLNTILQNVLNDQHVSAVDITAGQAGSNVQVNVKEYLPNDPTQSAVNSPEGSSLAHITLQVATPDAGGATSFAAMKVLDISTSLGAGGVSAATVTFKVTQAELLAMGKSTADIRLLHQVNGQWVPLPTTLVSGPDASGTYTFSAQTPSFSYFAIAAAQPVQSTSAGFAGLGVALLILGVLAVIAIVAVLVMKKKQA